MVDLDPYWSDWRHDFLNWRVVVGVVIVGVAVTQTDA